MQLRRPEGRISDLFPGGKRRLEKVISGERERERARRARDTEIERKRRTEGDQNRPFFPRLDCCCSSTAGIRPFWKFDSVTAVRLPQPPRCPRPHFVLELTPPSTSHRPLWSVLQLTSLPHCSCLNGRAPPANIDDLDDRQPPVDSSVSPSNTRGSPPAQSTLVSAPSYHRRTIASSSRSQPPAQAHSSASVLGRRRRSEEAEDDRFHDLDSDQRRSSSQTHATPYHSSSVSSATIAGGPASQDEVGRPRKRRKRPSDMIAETDDAHSSSPGLASRGMHSNGAAMTGLPAAGHTSGSRMSGPASATNGTSKAAQNGSRNRNGKAPATPYRGHNREEVTRLLIQSLVDLGYHNAAAIVSEESGYSLENADVAAFRHAVSTGLWQEAEALLFGAAAAQTRVEDSDHGIVLIAGADPDHMRFLLRQQKFLELLENRDTTMALHVLQKELTPLCQDMQRLHFLSSLLMCGAPSDVRNEAVWDGAGGKSRQHLLSELSSESNDAEEHGWHTKKLTACTCQSAYRLLSCSQNTDWRLSFTRQMPVRWLGASTTRMLPLPPSTPTICVLGKTSRSTRSRSLTNTTVRFGR